MEPDPPILVVDDDPVIRALVTARLRGRGYAVAACANGLDALAHASATPVEVAVTDLEMPGLGGLELIARLRREQPLARIIVLSGTASLATGMACLREGAFTLVTKPLGDGSGLDRAVEQARWVVADWREQLRRLVGRGDGSR